jgi:adenylate cyclase
MKCAACGFENPAGFKFCGSCGSALTLKCPSCGSDVPEGFRFCGNCGTSLEAAQPKAEPDILGDRRRVTVLFADLVGFSSLAEYLDPEDLRTDIAETFAELADAVEGHDGVVEKFIGDAVVAIFGAPIAHEDDPRRAVEVALQMQDIVAIRSEKSPTPLQLRIGINSGLVVSSPVGDGSKTGVLGDAVNVAARLQQAAEPGDILISDTVMRRVQSDFDSHHEGALDVKGRDQPVSAYRVMARRTGLTRLQAPFVGRREELALLDLLWSSVCKGNTHVVSLIGDPGVGKSRLLAEFSPRTDGLDVRVTCSSERAYGPFLDLIATILGGMPEDVEDLKKRAAAMGVDEEATTLLAAFLGLAGAPPVVRMADEQQKRQVFAGVWQWLLAAAAHRPVLMVLDDVHWADQSTYDLLGFLLQRLSAAPVMLLLAYRPGFEQVESAASRASHTAIRLEQLDAQESSALARGYLEVKSLPADLERVVISRAEGNAFFIEELLRALLELGSLAVVDGVAVLAKVDVSIPDTVEGTILARVDRLEPPERNVLQHAAVLGRMFTTTLIESILGEDAEESLHALARLQLIVPLGGDRWTFKHALVHEVTYDTLLLKRRRELHRRVAEALEASTGDEPGFLEILAEHYSRARVPAKARSYALAAGNLARDRLGFAEATLRYQTALRLWGDGDEEGRLDLLDKLGATALLGSDPSTAKTALMEAIAAWKARGRDDRAGTSLAILGRVHWVAGDSDRAADSLEEAISLLEHSGSSPGLVQVHVWWSSLLMLQGQMLEAIEVARGGLAVESEIGHPGFRSQLLNTLGVCASDLGDPTGVDQLREALKLAESSGDAEGIARAYVNLPSTLEDHFKSREAIEICRRGRSRVHRLGAPSYESFIAGNESSSLLSLGMYSEAEKLARDTLVIERSLGSPPGIVNVGNVLGVALTRVGRYEEAGRIFDEILPLGRGVGGTEFLAPLLTDIATLEAARGNPAVSRTFAQEALDMIRGASSLFHIVRILPGIVSLFPDAFPELVARCKAAAQHPSWHARILETEAWNTRSPQQFLDTADMYGRLERPYEEARCRLEGGDLEGGARLLKQYGLESGPLGARLHELVESQKPG